VFRENRRSASSQAVAGVCSVVRVKSILGVSSKVKESIKNPFRWKIWLGNVRVELYVRVRGDYCIRVCKYEGLVTSFVFG
jgi:hypothetical protein